MYSFSEPGTTAQLTAHTDQPHTKQARPTRASAVPSNRNSIAVPEMEHFDHDDIDLNPLFNTDRRHVRHALPHVLPLFGALCIAEGFATEAQVEKCLSLQARHYPGMPLGQILIRFGYILASELEQVLELQRELKSVMAHAFETSSILHALN